MTAIAKDRVEFRWDPARLKWSAGLLVAIGLSGLLLLGETDASVRVLGAVWAIVFAIGAWRVLRHIGDREPVVSVSAEGLRDRRIMDGVIPWASISNIENIDAEHVPFAGLEFHESKAVLANAKLMVRVTALLNRLLRFPDATLQMSLLDGNDEELHAAIRRYRSDGRES